MKEKVLLNTQQMIERLASKYSSPNYGFLTQVRSTTGYSNKVRTADGMAMSLWPSRGLHLIGFEVKISRSDWLHELKNPSKAEEIGKYCHQWYVAINNPDFIKEGELPPQWGLIAPSGTGLKIIKEAPFNPSAIPPDYAMVAGIFRNVAEFCIPKETLNTVMKERYDMGYLHGEQRAGRLKQDYERLRDRVSAFEKTAGIEISGWSNENVGEAVKQVLEGKHLKSIETVKRMRERAVNLVKYLDDEVNHYQTL